MRIRSRIEEISAASASSNVSSATREVSVPASSAAALRAGQGTRFDMSTFAYDLATGNRLWVQRFDGAKHYDDTSWGIAVTPDGSKVVVTGTSTDTDAGSDYVTIAYDTASGDQVWLGRYDGLVGSSDSAHAIALDATEDGVRMFVTGQSATAGSFDTGIEIDMATVAYFDPWS